MCLSPLSAKGGGGDLSLEDRLSASNRDRRNCRFSRAALQELLRSASSSLSSIFLSCICCILAEDMAALLLSWSRVKTATFLMFSSSMLSFSNDTLATA